MFTVMNNTCGNFQSLNERKHSYQRYTFNCICFICTIQIQDFISMTQVMIVNCHMYINLTDTGLVTGKYVLTLPDTVLCR